MRDSEYGFGNGVHLSGRNRLQSGKGVCDEEIDFSDCPEITPEMFAKAVVRQGLPATKAKAQVTLRIDSDVLEWFKRSPILRRLIDEIPTGHW